VADEPEEKPARRKRRSRKAADAASEGAPASEAPRASEPDLEADAPSASASEPDATSEPPAADEIEATPEDVAAEEATEVELEADAEAEGESELPDDSEDENIEEHEADEPEEDEDEEEPSGEAKPSRRRRRRGAAAEEAAPAPAPTRRRRPTRDPSLPPPEVRAQAKYVRSSARKARLVCDHIRGKSVEEARAILALTPRAIARDWSKLLESAVANAEHNHELVGEDLYVKAIHADEGPTIKRFQPRAMGRATRIRKRTSHLTILLTPKE
jgi:ribosomal protein L22